MSDTPRVDEIKQNLFDIWVNYRRMHSLASELEREVTAAHKRIAELEQVSAAGVKDALIEFFKAYELLGVPLSENPTQEQIDECQRLSDIAHQRFDAATVSARSAMAKEVQS